MSFFQDLKPISVKPGKLVLDPNNPRLITHEMSTIGEERWLDEDVRFATRAAMTRPEFRIAELKSSIRVNGYVPIDYMFVKRYRDTDFYIVLEGNRRATAITELLKEDPVIDKELREALENIEVIEVKSDLPNAEVQKHISYLLGVRHHGALKQWSPFARSHNIYLRYLEYADVEPTEFFWDREIAIKVAKALSIEIDEVEARLRVFIAMKQLSNYEPVKCFSASGLKATDYSIVADALKNKNKNLKAYFMQGDGDLRLSEESIQRFDTICKFSAGRKGAPVDVPAEWAPFIRILNDPDEERRKIMITEVEVEGRNPSNVWADRAEELYHLQWERWLEKVSEALADLSLGASFDTPEGHEALSQLNAVIFELDARDK